MESVVLIGIQFIKEQASENKVSDGEIRALDGFSWNNGSIGQAARLSSQYDIGTEDGWH